MNDKTGYALLAGGAALLIAVGSWLAFSERPPGDGQQRSPYVLPVVLASVERRDIEPHVQLTGTVRARNHAVLGFEVAGVVSALHALEAEPVRAGDVLARLGNEDQVLFYGSRYADLAIARRELAVLEAGSRPEEKARLRAELDVARAEAAQAALEVERGRALLGREVITQANLDRLRSLHDAAQARVEVARQRLVEAEAGARAEDLAVARAIVRRAEGGLEVAEHELAKTALRAPWDGVVVRRAASVGNYVERGQPIVELVDLATLEVAVEVPSRFAHRLGPRPRTRITVDELPDFEVQAELDAQAPVADALSRNSSGLIRLRRGEPAGGGLWPLKPGTFVRVDLALEPLRGALVVPSDAVRVTAKGPVVVLAAPAPAPEGGPAETSPPGGGPQAPSLVARWVPVRVLGEDEGGTAVRPLGEGLEVGDQVVVTGVDLAFPGASLLPRGTGPAGASGASAAAQDPPEIDPGAEPAAEDDGEAQAEGRRS